MERMYKMIDVHGARRRFILGLIFILLTTSVFYGFTRDVYQNQKSYKDSLIRFHVLANSDSPEDQALKLKVRDRIIEAMNPRFEQSDSLDETRKIIQENLEEIEAIASAEIQRNGSNYAVKASLSDVVFPTKNYGSITLPAGTYEALRVEIGKAEGSNWWCVLFPPLCFIDIEKGLTNEKTKQEMMNVLTEEEFKMIQTASSEDRIPIKLKFKVVEIIETAKLNLGKVVGMR
ncbi:stage II sporulation protein R [Anaerosolibacter carboniphilus]|uniref:Stage II sporulation protein R n=1 Tax=Anaerosolibacter carboniphilus TaxID=1417629 RepID=A0A841KZM0_9FIRM|nr:stage II sporulation protein R [Anaerosolibacter carboniphilus]MBB6215575.1 stage II sporulation protein R [Anaerosolibacter carboniphilus]